MVSNNLFQLIDTEFELSFDPEKLTTLEDLPIVNINQMMPPGTAYWIRYYDSFDLLNGFNIIHPAQADEIYLKIQNLKVKLNNSLTVYSPLVKELLTRKVLIHNIFILRLNSNKRAVLHVDVTRNISLNIGLKNSNSHRVIIYDGEIVSKDLINENNKKFSFIMNDGEAYVIRPTQPHAIEPLDTNSKNSNTNRYIISCSL